jgi:very-short-patch-repair endonuclease
MPRRLPPETINRSRDLRRQLTDAERLLWWKLRDLNNRGWHFRRQAPFRAYYLDFAEHSARVVVELDGSHHGEPKQLEHDAIRDRVLTKEGYLVLRFPNHEVFDNLDGVAECIIRTVTERRPSPPPEKSLRDFSTSPQGGGHARSPISATRRGRS